MLSPASSSEAAPVSAAAPEGVYDDDAPEPPRLKRLRQLVSLLLIVLIAGVSVVVIALLLKLKEIRFEAPAREAATPGAASPAPIPGVRPGERLVEARANADRITLLLEDASGARRVILLDGASFRPIGALADTPRPEAPPPG